MAEMKFARLVSGKPAKRKKKSEQTAEKLCILKIDGIIAFLFWRHVVLNGWMIDSWLNWCYLIRIFAAACESFQNIACFTLLYVLFGWRISFMANFNHGELYFWRILFGELYFGELYLGELYMEPGFRWIIAYHCKSCRFPLGDPLVWLSWFIADHRRTTAIDFQLR